MLSILVRYSAYIQGNGQYHVGSEGGGCRARDSTLRPRVHHHEGLVREAINKMRSTRRAKERGKTMVETPQTPSLMATKKPILPKKTHLVGYSGS